MRNLLSTACAALFAAAAPAHAALVNHGAYATDTTSGLDWRNLTLSEGLSYNQTVPLLSTTLAGWQIATAAQVTQLFTDAGLPAAGFVYEMPGYTPQVTAFMTAIGDTLLSHPSAQYVHGVTGFYAPTASELAFGIVDVAAAMLDSAGNATIGASGLAGDIYTTTTGSIYGPYLVATSSPVASSVPEPAGVALLGLGLLALAGCRRVLI